MAQAEKMLDTARLCAFAARRFNEHPTRISLSVRPLRGGLESCAVGRVEVTFTRSNRPKQYFVAKRVTAPLRREVDAYRILARERLRIAPQLLGTEDTGNGATYLYVEWIDSCLAWPWRDTALVAHSLAQLARLHATPISHIRPTLTDWDYENELSQSADSTFQAFESVARRPELGPARCWRGTLRRIVCAVTAIRRQLLSDTVLLHGDAHSANMTLRVRRGMHEALMLDWARARLGSPLEDVSSWLQSLGYWEWQAHRRHDTLLRGYLEARGQSPVLSDAFRQLYWLAGASNALAGALRYHLSFLKDDVPMHVRCEHARAARDWLRIVRRADACWRG